MSPPESSAMKSQKSAQKHGTARMLRAVIENVYPEIDGGRFPIKRTVGEKVQLEADIHADGHDVLSARILYRPSSKQSWQCAPMRALGNDRWAGEFRIEVEEPHVYTLQGWPDAFRTWARDLKKRSEAGQELALEFLIGAELILAAASRADGRDQKRLREIAGQLKEFRESDPRKAYQIAESEELLHLMDQHADFEAATTYRKELKVEVDRERARFGAWYEMFPRSCTKEMARHGTFRDCIERLDYIAGMGSTCSICRQSTRLEKSNAKAGTIRQAPSRMMWEARGRSARSWADTREYIRNWELWKISNS